MNESSDHSVAAAAEHELVRRMLAGDQVAFDWFFNTHAARLAGFAARRCALDPAALEDVVQQTMINAIRNLQSFRGESALFTWLCQICRNVLADVRRKAERQPAAESLEALSSGMSASLPIQLIDYRDPLEACSADSLRSAVRGTINRLPPRYGRILELRYGDELPIGEIARILELSESAAQSLLARARKAFGECWTDHAGEFGTHRNDDAGVP